MIFETLAPYAKLMDIFVRDQDTWYDVKRLRRKVGWNNKKIYTGLDVLNDYGILTRDKVPSEGKAMYSKFNSSSEIGMLLSSLYAKLRERKEC